MSMAAPPPRTRTMSHMRRPLPSSSSASTGGRPRASLGGPGEQMTPRSGLGLSSPRPRSSLSMIERPVSLGGRGLVEQSASGMARPSPLSSSRPLPPGRSTSGGKRAGANSPVPFGEISDVSGASEVLEGALRREVEEKEELMMRLASRDDSIARLETRIADLGTNMDQGEARLIELYAEQERWESERAALEREIAKKTTVIDKLRIQLRELEKENKECARRLTEQAAQFESERQAFYDNTTHLKSRIQSLSDQQREWKERLREEEEQELKEEATEPEPEPEPEANVETEAPSAESPVVPARRRAFHHRIRSSVDRDATELPEMTALKLELSTLNTSHGSLGQTVKMLQGQLADLERVNLTLQEENEAFTTLLREKTLSGQMNMLARGASRSPSPTPPNEEQQPEQEQLEQETEESGSKSGLLSPMQSPPPRVRTHSRASRPNRPTSPARSAKSARRVAAETLAAETLANLPVAGPGLDLAAELGRAEIIRLDDDSGEPLETEKPKVPEAPKEDEAMKAMRAEFEALKSEIKTLKEENKGLTLYASKIIDRIISQEAFEHILAVDYRKPQEVKPAPAPAPAPAAPLKGFFQRATSLSMSSSSPPVIGTRPPLKITTDSSVNDAAGPDSPATPMGKREKRGISMDWSRLNPFGTKVPNTPVEDVRTSGLKPLALGKTPPVKEEEPEVIHGGRKLDNQEDENDRVERERLNAEMSLMGIQRAANIHTPSATSFAAAGQALVDPVSRSSSSTPALGGMVGWGKRPNSGPSQMQPTGRVPTGELRAEHLELLSDDGHSSHSPDYEVREVENQMAALAEREKHLSAEMAKGKSGGFTEPPARGTRVRRRTNSTTGSITSTLFSAGRLSRGESENGIGEEPEHE